VTPPWLFENSYDVWSGLWAGQWSGLSVEQWLWVWFFDH
jgi:hypothetical protein